MFKLAVTWQHEPSCLPGGADIPAAFSSESSAGYKRTWATTWTPEYNMPKVKSNSLTKQDLHL